MSFDNSRYTFDPRNDYSGVVMEQGRVQVDADWNEWLAEISRRTRAEALDTLGDSLGRGVYPATTPFAFHLSASQDSKGNHLAIGSGRMYVDGLLAENHGIAVNWQQSPAVSQPAAGVQWDPALDEMSGAPQIPHAGEVTIDFTQQPYLPGATLPAGNGPFLAYLDVWQRAVTYLEDPGLIDPAVGVDTTGRLQTVWQVKLLDVSTVSGVSCSTPDAGIAAWQSLIAPSAGTLTTGVVQSTPSGPCCLTSNTGFTGLENQLYRVEIHKAGGAGATFKWSRDNASVITGVTAISTVTNSVSNKASQLVVQSLGRDQVLGFAPGNWIEITDDWLELNGQHGELHRIDSIDVAARTITLDSVVAAASFPTPTGTLTDPSRHTRIVRWDQSGKVFQSDGTTVWVDLDAAGSTGEIPVPPAGTTLILEDGVTVAFGLNPAAGTFDTGDFWTFAARTADGSVQALTQAPPRGIHHHFARLSIVTFPNTATDCRIAWPPTAGGGCCECTVTVQPGDPLQTILDKFQATATPQLPVTICLMPGVYSLPKSLRFYSNMSLRAAQEGTVTIQAQPGQEPQFADGLVVLDNVSNTGFYGLNFAAPAAPFRPPQGKFAGLPLQSLPADIQVTLNNLVVAIALRPVNCTQLTIEDCGFTASATAAGNVPPFSAAIFAAGKCGGWRVVNNTFSGALQNGILVAPSAAFSLPSTSAPAPGRFGFTGALARAAAAFTSTLATGIATGITTVAGGITTVSGGITNAPPPVQFSPSLAANGGTVLPAELDDSIIEENTFSGLGLAALVFAEPGNVRCTSNRTSRCVAGFWFISPLQGLLVSNAFLDPHGTAAPILSVAMGYPLPQGDTTAASQFVTVPAAPSSVRLFMGPNNFTDSQGNVWIPDSAAGAAVQVTGGSLFQPVPPPNITGTPDTALYQSERRGTSFSYTFRNLPRQGFYQVTLKFAEIADQAKGVRIFNVAINGVQVLTNFDIVGDAGAPNAADDHTFTNLSPDAQGQIVVQFTGTSFGSDPNAKISALAVDPQWGGQLPNANELLFFYMSLAQLALQSYSGFTFPPARLRVDSSEMQGLGNFGLMVLGRDMLQTGSTSSLMMSGNRMELGATTDRRALAVCIIFQVTSCLITGNMLLSSAVEGLALLLEDANLPATQIMVSANVMGGRMIVVPDPRPNVSAPAPMNTWEFLNTLG